MGENTQYCTYADISALHQCDDIVETCESRSGLSILVDLNDIDKDVLGIDQANNYTESTLVRTLYSRLKGMNPLPMNNSINEQCIMYCLPLCSSSSSRRGGGGIMHSTPLTQAVAVSSACMATPLCHCSPGSSSIAKGATLNSHTPC